MKQIKCQECGKQLSKKARICPHCGTSTKYKTRIATPIILAIAIIIISVALVLVYLAYRKQLYMGVMYSYTTSKNDYSYIYGYEFKDDNTYTYLISESDIKAITEELNNNNYEYISSKYTKSIIINGKYTKSKNKLYLHEDNTNNKYKCDIIGYEKIKCEDNIYSFDRKEQVKIKDYLKSLKKEREM